VTPLPGAAAARTGRGAARAGRGRPQQAMARDYDEAARGWRSGPGPLYECFARRLVARAPMPLAGARVLDLGAGTGALAGALADAGAVAVAADLSPAMARALRAGAPGTAVVVSDATRLALADACMDAVASAFVLNHVPAPHRLLAEAARVTRPGGWVLATTFAAGDDHPAKRVVDDVAAAWGWHEPPWYGEQRRWAALTDTPAGLAAQARAAGLLRAHVERVEADTGPLTAADVVAWRLGHAHLAGFVRSLPSATRARLAAEAEARLGPGPHELRRMLLMLSIQVAA